MRLRVNGESCVISWKREESHRGEDRGRQSKRLERPGESFLDNLGEYHISICFFCQEILKRQFQTIFNSFSWYLKIMLIYLCFLYWLLLFQKPYMEGGLFSFFTLLAWAKRVSSKNKTHVPPGLWEQGPPAYCFGIWRRTGRIWPREREILQSGYRQRGSRGGRAAVLSRKELRKYSFLHKIACNFFVYTQEIEIKSILY